MHYSRTPHRSASHLIASWGVFNSMQRQAGCFEKSRCDLQIQPACRPPKVTCYDVSLVVCILDYACREAVRQINLRIHQHSPWNTIVTEIDMVCIDRVEMKLRDSISSRDWKELWYLPSVKSGLTHSTVGEWNRSNFKFKDRDPLNASWQWFMWASNSTRVNVKLNFSHNHRARTTLFKDKSMN